MGLIIIAIIVPILIGYISSVIPTHENVDAKLRIFTVVLILLMITLMYNGGSKDKKSNPQTPSKNSVKEPINCDVDINCSSPCGSEGQVLYIEDDCSGPGIPDCQR